MLKRILRSLFNSELNRLNEKLQEASKLVDDLKDQKRVFDTVLRSIDVSVDVHEYHYSNSWAVISLQGDKTDYIKFVDLGEKDIREISSFLRQFERNTNVKIDASPSTSAFLKRELKHPSKRY